MKIYTNIYLNEKNEYNKMYNSIKNLNNIFKKKTINLQIGFVVTFILKKY